MNENKFEDTNNESQHNIEINDDVCCYNTMEDIVNNVDDNIQIKLCTGAVYLIDPEMFKSNEMINYLSIMNNNDESIRNMMFTLLTSTFDNKDSEKEFLDSYEKQINEFFESFNITDEYQKFNPNLSQREKIMFMCFDAYNIIHTLFHHTELFYTMSLMTLPANLDSEENMITHKSCHCGGNCSGELCSCKHDEKEESNETD